MLGRLPYKTKQFFIAIIKLSIIVGATYYIYNKLVNNEQLHFSQFASLLHKNNIFSIKNISFLLILTVFNWFFEILKWQTLVNSVKKITYFEALKQSLGALTASLITPNRIGDYGAKALYFLKPYRKRILLLNLAGNISQMTITTIFGCISLFLFYQDYDLQINFRKISRFIFIIAVTLSVAAFGIRQSRYKIRGFTVEKLSGFFRSITLKTHVLNFSCALLRYLIFSFQFYYLLQIFNVAITYKTAMIVISSMYLLASVIPTLAIFDVLIKGSIAVYLFGFIGVNALTILSITTLMWLLNFILPSIIGVYFVLNFKLPKTTD